MGYLVTGPAQLMADLRAYLSGRTLSPGEGRPLVSLLSGLLSYLSHPSLHQEGRPAREAIEVGLPAVFHYVATSIGWRASSIGWRASIGGSVYLRLRIEDRSKEGSV